MSDDLDFIVIDDIPEYVFCIPDDEELENVIPVKGEDGSFKYEKVAELPATGEDGVLYLVPKPHETQTASGNPINLNVTGGAGKLTDLKLDGDTSQQTLTGKNKLNTNYRNWTLPYTETSRGITFTVNADGSVVINGTNDGTGNSSIQFNVESTTPFIIGSDAMYSGSLNATNGESWVTFMAYSGSTYRNMTNQARTLTAGNWGLYIQVDNGNTRSFSNYKIYPQLEIANAPTSYEPFVGGIPSPNPDYPQDINVVTGTQTIDINGTSYPINLGNIELAEIGTYRDYIHKVGNEWKVHKAIGKVVLDGTPTDVVTYSNYGLKANVYALRATISDIVAGATSLEAMSDKYHVYGTGSWTDWYQNAPNITLGDMSKNVDGKGVLISAPYTENTQSLALAWLANNPATLYYQLATPTTTQITDTNLINQLEAARNVALANGTNVISNTATGNNLAGDLELSYYEYDPTNKYNKWLWLDDDAAYEQI